MVEAAGVGDASTFSIPGFPYLRTNRFLAALKKDLKDDKEREAWVKWMQQLDLSARKKEISNLPEEMVLSFLTESGGGSREELTSQMVSCSSELLNYDQARSDFHAVLSPLVHIPDEYSFFRRAVGLYPLVSIPVAVATEISREKVRKRFDKDLKDLPVDGEIKAIVPEKRASFHEKELQEVIEDSKRNPLAIPILDRDQEERIASSFAPVFVQDVAAPYDRLGQIVWKEGRLEIDSERPTVYYYVSHAFLRDEPILQINYVIWYSERAGERSPRIERGHIDGLTARISLDGQGRIFMVDVVNDCGCYHFFAPQRERVDRILSKPFQFSPLVPQWLPEIPPGESLGIRINSGWHQVQRLLSLREPSDRIPYALVPYDLMESLSNGEARRASIFDARGIVKGSERVERFIFFSMGIPSVGSMRQRSHHAIELIGRAHFDDPFLFDENFVSK